MVSTVVASLSATARPVAAAGRRSSLSARAPSPAVRLAGRGGGRRAAPLRTAQPVKAQYYDEQQEQAPRALRQHPNPDFIKETVEAFPDKGVCDVEEALVLFLEAGYKMLDVRSQRLYDIGNAKGAIHVPFITEKKRFVDGKMEIDTFPNEQWLDQVKQKIPNKEAKLIVVDLDGRTSAIDCLETMFEAGYENIVGLKGGFKVWFKTFDNKLRRRVFGEYEENYGSYDQLGSGDSCGIHSSGAGFQNQDRLSGDFWDNF